MPTTKNISERDVRALRTVFNAIGNTFTNGHLATLKRGEDIKLESPNMHWGTINWDSGTFYVTLNFQGQTNTGKAQNFDRAITDAWDGSMESLMEIVMVIQGLAELMG